jgi:hypothetical protein
MKNFIVFAMYFVLGVFLIFSFKQISQTINSQQLKTPLSQSTFFLNSAPSESLRGTIMSLVGDVGWRSRIATEPARITKPTQVQQGEGIVTEKDSGATVVFSNIANINIFSKTNINFIQTLPSNILFEQNIGIVNYKILGSNIVNIRCLSLLIKANQGEVEVSVNENQPYIIIDVKIGSITVGYNDINYVTQVLDVKSGKRLIFRTDFKRINVLPL